MTDKCMSQFKFELIGPILFINLLFLFVLVHNFLCAFFIFFIFYDKTDLWRSICPLLPPLDFVIINNCICFISCDFISLICQHENIAKLFSIRLIMGNFLNPINKPWDDLKLRIFGLSIVMCKIMSTEHFGESM